MSETLPKLILRCPVCRKSVEIESGSFGFRWSRHNADGRGFCVMSLVQVGERYLPEELTRREV